MRPSTTATWCSGMEPRSRRTRLRKKKPSRSSPCSRSCAQATSADGPSLRSNESQAPFRTSRRRFPRASACSFSRNGSSIIARPARRESRTSTRGRGRVQRGQRQCQRQRQRRAVPASEAASVSLVRGKVIVPFALNLSEFREAWESAAKARAMSVSLPALYEALGDSKRAGQEHQAWRGIEGKALRQKARP